jgi:hypothetical protein
MAVFDAAGLEETSMAPENRDPNEELSGWTPGGLLGRVRRLGWWNTVFAILILIVVGGVTDAGRGFVADTVTGLGDLVFGGDTPPSTVAATPGPTTAGPTSSPFPETPLRVAVLPADFCDLHSRLWPNVEDAKQWVTAGATDQGSEVPFTGNVRLAVQGTTPTAVVLSDMRVRIRSQSPAGGVLARVGEVCGGDQSVRRFAVDLLRSPPSVTSIAGSKTPAVDFPYRVSNGDPEVFNVAVDRLDCDCTWVIEIDWASAGQTGTLTVDNNGRPFRTTSTSVYACTKTDITTCTLR